jgi:hypothetical protein
MAKKQVLDSIQKQFYKIQFKKDDAVFFTWLGIKKYGYVIRIKETNWGIQYTVDSEGTKYPCGIQIKTRKTAYTTGCIDHDETRALGQQELVTRIQTGHPSTYSEVFRDTRRTDNESRDDDTNIGGISNTVIKTNAKSRSSNKSKDVVKSSSTRMSASNTSQRNNIELDDAIRKQRDFLNGFVKKD